jgi:hypothetical protein
MQQGVSNLVYRRVRELQIYLFVPTSAEAFSTNVQEIPREQVFFVEQKINHLVDDSRGAFW